MRYDADEALRRTLERSAVLRKRNSRRRGIVLSAVTVCCACALLMLDSGLVLREGTALGEAGFGAFLLPSRAGGYILASVLAFAAGVLATLFFLRRRQGWAAKPEDAFGGKSAGNPPGLRETGEEPERSARKDAPRG